MAKIRTVTTRNVALGCREKAASGQLSAVSQRRIWEKFTGIETVSFWLIAEG